ncbi:ribonuclease [Desulfocarbo indianensis]|nr:ribonuclease [Desulfocarbo indianensis]
MIKKMLINASDPEELRVALVEDGKLEGFFVETASREQTRGNIYKGVVANIEPSLQAAFVDYGSARHGFLQIGDVRPELYLTDKSPEKGLPPIREVLRRGQEFLVQVVKEETGNKGASLTTFLSLPGQVLVLAVGRDAWGVSRKIDTEAERARVKKILGDIKVPEGFGIIARTAAEGRPKKDIQAEVRMLLRLWQDLKKNAKKAKAPSLIHKEQELAVRTVRDLFTSDVTEILVDNCEVHARVERFVSLANPRRKNAVKLYREPRPIFAKYEIEEQLKSIYQPQVRLASGASIVIHPTEALVSVDVNSGKAIKGKEIEDTALNVNLEAAAEIARQLRLRDLGGLIVIDFIDMRERKHQRQVLKTLKDELKKDKAKVSVGSFSRFGLIELSRQRIRPPVDFGSTRACPHCQGRGILRTPEAIGRGVVRSLERKLGKGCEGAIRVTLAPETAHYLANAKRADLARLEAASGVCLEIVSETGLGPEEFRLAKVDPAWPLPAPAAPSEEESAPPAAGPPQAAPPAQPPSQAGDSPEPAQPAKPPRKRRRSPRRKKAADSANGPESAELPPSGAEPGPEPPAAEPEALAENGEGAEQEAKPRRRSRRRRPRRRRKPAGDSPAEANSEPENS